MDDYHGAWELGTLCLVNSESVGKLDVLHVWRPGLEFHRHPVELDNERTVPCDIRDDTHGTVHHP